MDEFSLLKNVFGQDDPPAAPPLADRELPPKATVSLCYEEDSNGTFTTKLVIRIGQEEIVIGTSPAPFVGSVVRGIGVGDMRLDLDAIKHLYCGLTSGIFEPDL